MSAVVILPTKYWRPLSAAVVKMMRGSPFSMAVSQQCRGLFHGQRVCVSGVRCELIYIYIRGYIERNFFCQFSLIIWTTFNDQFVHLVICSDTCGISVNDSVPAWCLWVVGFESFCTAPRHTRDLENGTIPAISGTWH